MSGLTLSRIMEIADRLFPFNCAEPWDNCGLQLGDPCREIRSIAFSLDATPRTIRFASEMDCELLITHHPVIMDPLRQITPATMTGLTLIAAARAGVDVLSLHTNLDAARGGLNDYLAQTLGLKDVIIPLPAACARLGTLPRPGDLHSLAQIVARSLDIPAVRLVCEENREIQRVFCVSGSGMGFLKDALHHRADVMVTGDVRYHAAREALEMGMPVIDAGHFGLEKVAAGLMSEAFRKEFSEINVDVTCHQCRMETEPFLQIYKS